MANSIKERVQEILSQLPAGVELEAAAKSRQPFEIIEAIEAGIKIVGENYVQEAERAYREIGQRCRWHMIGHLQKNKAKKAVEIFDLIETLDSLELALEIDKRAAAQGKVMSVLIEVNSGREPQKAGVFPEDVEGLIRSVSGLKNIRILGLMTMGPLEGSPEDFIPYFRETRRIFEHLKTLNIQNVEMQILSMGMTASWRVAIEEGANLVRIGTGIFGPRHQDV